MANIPSQSQHLSQDCNLYKFMDKNLTPDSVINFIQSQCPSNTQIKSKKSEILNAYQHRLNQILKIIQEFFEYLKISVDDESSKLFEIYLDECYTHFTSKLKDTPSTKFVRQKIIKDTQKLIEKLLMHQEKATARLNKKLSNIQAMLKKNELQILDIAHRKDNFKEEKSLEIDDEIYDGNIKIIKKLKQKSDTEKVLKADEKVASMELQKLLDQNKIKKGILLEQKLKAEQALMAILIKFDTNIGSRVAEIEAIQGEIAEENRKFEEWKSTIFTQQEADYIALMTEKEEEEAQLRAQRLEEIKVNHAAKVIQKSWKRFRIRQKRNTKKKKDGVKKLK